jgi:hypothetical protein
MKNMNNIPPMRPLGHLTAEKSCKYAFIVILRVSRWQVEEVLKVSSLVQGLRRAVSYTETVLIQQVLNHTINTSVRW